jgi:hypothetical protein
METSQPLNSRRLVALASALLVVAVVVAVSTERVRAQSGAGLAGGEFVVNGFQADSSSPVTSRSERYNVAHDTSQKAERITESEVLPCLLFTI